MNVLHLLARGTASTLWLAEDLVKATGDTLVDAGQAIGVAGHAVLNGACQVDELLHVPARLDELCQRVAELELTAARRPEPPRP